MKTPGIRLIVLAWISILFLGACEAAQEAPTVTPAPAVTATSATQTVRILNAQSAESFVNLAWSADGALLATSGNDPVVRVWDVSSLKMIHEFTRPGMAGARFTRFSPSGRWLMIDEISHGKPLEGGAVPVYFDAAIWDLQSGERLTQLTSNAIVWNAVWSPGGDILAYWNSLGDDHEVKFWTAPGSSKQPPQPFTPAGIDEIGDVIWQPDGTLVIAGTSGDGLAIWRSDQPDKPEIFQGVIVDFAEGLALSPDASLVSAAGYKDLKIWGLTSKMLLYQLQPKALSRPSGAALAFSPDSSLMANGVDQDVVIWDMATGGIVARLEGHEQGVSSLAFSPDGKTMAVGEAGGEVRLWYLPAYLKPPATPTPIPTNTPAPEFAVEPQSLMTFKVSPPPSENSLHLSDIAWGDERTVRVTYALQPEYGRFESWQADYDASTGKELTSGRTAAYPYRVFYSPDRSRYAAWVQGADAADIESSTVSVFDMASQKTLFTIPPTEIGAGNEVAWSPDGAQVAIQTFDRVVVYDARTGRHLLSMDDVLRPDAQPQGHMTVQWSPDGKWISSSITGAGTGAHAVVWDAVSGAVSYEIAEAQDNPTTMEYGIIEQLAWAPDSRRLLIQRSTRLEILDIASRTIRLMPPSDNEVSLREYALWSADGDYAAVNGQVLMNGPAIVYLWNTRTDLASVAYEYSPDAQDVGPWNLAWAPDRPWLATVDAKDLVVIDAASLGAARVTLPFDDIPFKLVWSPHGRLAAGEPSGGVAIWDLGK